MVVISLVIGIGIFRTPAIVAKDTGSPELFFLAWLTGGFICLIGGLTFAEIGSRKPIAGGFYKVVSEAYHPAFAFMINWLGVIITVSATFAAVAFIASEYLIKSIGDFIPFINYQSLASENGIKITASVITTFLFFINYLGIKSGAKFLNFITILKIAIILIFAVSAFFTSTPQLQNSTPVSQNTSFFTALFGFFIGLRAVFFTVGGYQLTTNLAADVVEPKRNLPKAIIVGVIIVITLYLLINIGYYKILGFYGIAGSNLIAADLADIIFGSAGSRIISMAIFISAVGFLNATVMYIPRTYHAMAEDKIIPAIFKKVNPKTQVQEFVLIFMFLLILLFTFTLGKFDNILNVIMFNDSLVIAITASTLFIFRYRSKRDNVNFDGFKTPFYPILPAIFISFLLIVSFFAFKEDIISGFISIFVLAVSLPLYFLFRNLNKKRLSN